jgi:hypothetical protein
MVLKYAVWKETSGYDSIETKCEGDKNPAHRSEKYIGSLIESDKNLFLTQERGNFTYDIKPYKKAEIYMTQ